MELSSGFMDVAQGADRTHPVRVRLRLETNRYLVKTAETHAELLCALRLRHDVFLARDLGKPLASGLDVDEFDPDSDHLLVIDRGSGEVIGNYRIRCSSFHRSFYSETEFFLGDWLGSSNETKVEIGRACVHPAHRGGAVIQLLWRGLLEYLEEVGGAYLFGCSSVSAKERGLVEAAWRSILRNRQLSETFRALPRRPYPLDESLEIGDREMPSLLATYLKAGAVVLGPPAHDPAFECADFLTLMDVRKLGAARFRRSDA